MENRELKVLLLNVLKYEDKENKGVWKSRLGYICVTQDALQESEKFKGLAELSYFTTGTDLFDKLSKNHMYQTATLNFEKVVNPRNPLRDSMKLVSIKLKDETISLL